jgi:hypothetical protein
MINNRASIKGKVTVTVFDSDGNIKRNKQNWFQKLLGLKGSPMVCVNHNIVTDEGDALIADLLAQTPARTKVDNTNGKIPVGTGWTGVTPKTNTWLNTQTGTAKALSSTYPKLKGSFGAADDNVVQFRCLFAAGDLNTTGINEVGLANALTATGDLLAYAEITPSVNVTSSDTLQIDWELTFVGS